MADRQGLLVAPLELHRRSFAIAHRRSHARLSLVVEPFLSRVQIRQSSSFTTKPRIAAGLSCKWRIDRDSNPGYPLGVYTISNRAPSTTRPSIHERHYSYCQKLCLTRVFLLKFKKVANFLFFGPTNCLRHNHLLIIVKFEFFCHGIVVKITSDHIV